MTESEKNASYKEYLIRKTIQQYSVRQDEEYQNPDFLAGKNMTLYINKKTSQMRNGKNVQEQKTTKELKNLIQLKSKTLYSNVCDEKLNNRNAHKEKAVEYYDNNEKKLKQEAQPQLDAEKQKHDKIRDQNNLKTFLKQKGNRKNRTGAIDKVKYLVNEKIPEGKIKDFYKQFQRIQLQDKIDNLRKQGQQSWKITDNIQEVKKHQKTEFLSKKQISEFMTQVVESSGINVGKLLNIEERVIYKTEQQLKEEKEKEEIMGVDYDTLMLKEIELQEERNQQAIIKIFKQTQLDQSELDKVSLRKKMEAQEKLYKVMWEEEKKNYRQVAKPSQDMGQNPQKFERKKDLGVDHYQKFLAETHEETMLKLSKSKNKKFQNKNELRKKVYSTEGGSGTLSSQESKDTIQDTTNEQQEKQNDIQKSYYMVTPQKKNVKINLENTANNTFNTNQNGSVTRPETQWSISQSRRSEPFGQFGSSTVLEQQQNIAGQNYFKSFHYNPGNYNGGVRDSRNSSQHSSKRSSILEDSRFLRKKDPRFDSKTKVNTFMLGKSSSLQHLLGKQQQQQQKLSFRDNSCNSTQNQNQIQNKSMNKNQSCYYQSSGGGLGKLDIQDVYNRSVSGNRSLINQSVNSSQIGNPGSTQKMKGRKNLNQMKTQSQFFSGQQPQQQQKSDYGSCSNNVSKIVQKHRQIVGQNSLNSTYNSKQQQQFANKTDHSMSVFQNNSLQSTNCLQQNKECSTQNLSPVTSKYDSVMDSNDSQPYRIKQQEQNQSKSGQIQIEIQQQSLENSGKKSEISQEDSQRKNKFKLVSNSEKKKMIINNALQKVFQREIDRRNNKINTESNLKKFNNFLDKCEDVISYDKLANSEYQNEIDSLENKLEYALKMTQVQEEGNQNAEMQPLQGQFLEFKREKYFKRKMVNFLVNKCSNSNQVMQAFRTKDMHRQFLEEIQKNQEQYELDRKDKIEKLHVKRSKVYQQKILEEQQKLRDMKQQEEIQEEDDSYELLY